MEQITKSKEQFEIDFLTDKSKYYLCNNENIEFMDFKEDDRPDIALYRIDEISFEDQAPRKEALENVLSAMRIEGVNFIYLILGDENGVHFYYGVARDYSKNIDTELSIRDIGKYILEPGIRGNFRGSTITEVDREEKPEILDKIAQMSYCSMLEGVPGYTKEDEKFQGSDRLVDVMLGDEFAFLIIASAMNYDDVNEIERDLYKIYTKLVPLSKMSIQGGSSSNQGESTGETRGTSSSEGSNYSKSTQDSVTITDGSNFGKSKSENRGTTSGTSSNGSSKSTSQSAQEGKTTGTSSGTSHSEGKTTGGSESRGVSHSEGKSESTSTQTSTGSGSSSSATVEVIDKKAQDWIKYLDEVIIPRLDYGMGKGIFLTATVLMSTSKAKLKKLENTAISLYSGEKGNKVPLRAFPLEKNSGKKKLSRLKNFQLPIGKIRKSTSEQELVWRSALSQFIQARQDCRLGNWITTNELAMIAGLPKKEVVGLGLREEVEFGLNPAQNVGADDKICLGRLVQSGNILENQRVFLDKQNLDKHVFVTGVTGSGKTTTCQKILIDSDLPFLVIEPAKTEYRILAKNYDDLLVFTLGRDDTAPFRLNPFEFFPHESITSRVDMLMASIEASFDMEAAIPQLIETAIYECYKDYGWNIASNRNTVYGERAFEDGVYAFPILQDLVEKVEVVVKKQGFDERLKNDYIGSIKARLQGLLVGAKGLMLNTKRSIDFEKLITKRVVLEFEEIRSGSEKSLIMGFVLTNMMEAIKANFLKQGAYHHITLVEEAHRLLSKFAPGDSPNKKHGVETFSDMLAEIRKYGESLMIVDQIPNKLTPEILKNTNTKIVHRLFAEDDKNAVGNTIVLNKEQQEFLSNLEAGRAIVFTQGLQKAVQVQIEHLTDTTAREQVGEEEFRRRACQYYAKEYKRGVIEGTQYLFEKEPSSEEMEKVIEISRETELRDVLENYKCNMKYSPIYLDLLRQEVAIFGIDFLSKYILVKHVLKHPDKVGVVIGKEYYQSNFGLMRTFLMQYMEKNVAKSIFMECKENLY